MTESPDLKAAPLAGIRVLDFGHVVAGPFCARLLADLGAEVVKIETNLRQGQLGARRGAKPDASRHGRTALLAHVNRSRRSIDLNLKTEQGRDIARRLVAVADVIVENFSSGVMDRLGLGYEELRRLNPRLVFASMSGYGHTGPRRGWTSMNVNLQAHCGLMMATGVEGGPPIGIANSWNDYIAGLHACLAIVAALTERETTGTGRHLDVSQFEACVATVGAPVLASVVNGKAPPRVGNRSDRFAPQGCYRCAGADDWCAIVVEDDRQFQALAAVVPRLSDARYATLEGRRAHLDEIDAAIESWTRTLPVDEVERRLKSAGVKADWVRRADRLLETPEWQGVVRHVEDPPGSRTPVVSLPFLFGTSANPAPYPAPRLGENTAEVLRDWLGMDAREAEEFQRQGAPA